MGRLHYYLIKLKKELKEKGIKNCVFLCLDFLIKRKFFLQFLYESFEYHLISRFRNVQDTIIRRWDSEANYSADKILIYVGYDKDSRLQDHVMNQLKSFNEIGYQITFVTTSQFFTDQEYQKISHIVKTVIHRKNVGYDFCSYRVGYDAVKKYIPNLSSLIVMNDSCLGPFFELEDPISMMQKATECIYGNSKSYEITEYIQSYFYHFGQKVIQSGIVVSFFERIRILNSKWAIVRFLEIGSSKIFKKSGVELKALIDPVDNLIQNYMLQEQVTEPMGDPLGKKWIELKLTPFYKRSNLN